MDSILPKIASIVAFWCPKRSVTTKCWMSKSTILGTMYSSINVVPPRILQRSWWHDLHHCSALCKTKYWPCLWKTTTLICVNARIRWRQLGKLTVAKLSNDIVHNWDTKYSHELYPRCKKFDGDVDKEFNRHILCNKFHQLPLLKKLVDTFEKLFPYLSIDMVWLLIKSKPGAGFQKRHKVFALCHKITMTIVVNYFTMERCDLLGEHDCFFNISDNDEGNKAN